MGFPVTWSKFEPCRNPVGVGDALAAHLQNTRDTVAKDINALSQSPRGRGRACCPSSSSSCACRCLTAAIPSGSETRLLHVVGPFRVDACGRVVAIPSGSGIRLLHVEPRFLGTFYDCRNPLGVGDAPAARSCPERPCFGLAGRNPLGVGDAPAASLCSSLSPCPSACRNPLGVGDAPAARGHGPRRLRRLGLVAIPSGSGTRLLPEEKAMRLKAQAAKVAIPSGSGTRLLLGVRYRPQEAVVVESQSPRGRGRACCLGRKLTSFRVLSRVAIPSGSGTRLLHPPSQVDTAGEVPTAQIVTTRDHTN